MEDWKAKLSGILAGTPGLPDAPDTPELTDAPDTPVKPAKFPRLDIILDRKRAGKTATIIAGFAEDADIKGMAAQLKQKLGTGGSARGGEILIQGDRRADVGKILTAMGYKWRII